MSAKDKLNKRIELLNGYEKTIGLLPRETPGEYEELKGYLSLNKDQINSLGIRDIHAISVRLAQFALYFRRCINEERSNKTYAQSELNKIVAIESQQINNKYMRWDEKVLVIVKTNQAALEWYNILIYATQRIERLESISDDIKNLGYIISLISKIKG